MTPATASDPSPGASSLPAKGDALAWDAVHDVFRQRYWVEDRDLPEVMTMMKEEFGFAASVKQYKNQIEKWNLKKNIASEEYRAIVRIRKRRREEDGKDTLFTVRERPVPEEKIERFIKRHKAPESTPPPEDVPQPATPSDVGYCTPAPPSSVGTPRPPSPESVSSPMVEELGSLHLDPVEGWDPFLLPGPSLSDIDLVGAAATATTASHLTPTEGGQNDHIGHRSAVLPLHSQAELLDGLVHGAADHSGRHIPLGPVHGLHPMPPSTEILGLDTGHDLLPVPPTEILGLGTAFGMEGSGQEWRDWFDYPQSIAMPAIHSSEDVFLSTPAETVHEEGKPRAPTDVDVATGSSAVSIEDLVEGMSLNGDSSEDAGSVASGSTEVPTRAVRSPPLKARSSPTVEPDSAPPSRSDSTPLNERLSRLGKFLDGDVRPEVVSELDRRFHRAVVDDDVVELHSLLRAGASTETRLDKGMTALHIATVWGNCRLAAELLDHGADALAEVVGRFALEPHGGKKGPVLIMDRPSARHIAACLNDTCLLRLLPSTRSKRSGNITLAAVGQPKLENVVPLLESGTRDGEDNPLSPIEVAAALGHMKSLVLLGKDAAKIDLTNALVRAATFGRKKAVDALLTMGGNPNGSGHLPAPLAAAAANGYFGVVRLLLRQKHISVNIEASEKRRLFDGYTPLGGAVAHGNLEIARLLLEKGARPCDYHCVRRGAALTVACQRGDVAVAELLISCGAEINPDIWTLAVRSKVILAQSAFSAQEEKRLAPSPLAAAASAGKESLVRLLIGRGAQINTAPLKTVIWPLKAAAQGGSLDVARTLLELGADVNPRDARHWPLTAACARGDVEMARLLLQHGARVVDGAVSPALSAAVKARNRDLVRLLVEAGSDGGIKIDTEWFGNPGDAREKDVLGELYASTSKWDDDFPLVVAVRVGDPAIVKLLLDESSAALISAPANRPNLARLFESACYSSSVETVRLLLERTGLSIEDLQNEGPCHESFLATASSAPKNVGTVRLLLERGVDVNSPGPGDRTGSGQSPLFVAAGPKSDADEATIELLLQHRAHSGLCTDPEGPMSTTFSEEVEWADLPEDKLRHRCRIGLALRHSVGSNNAAFSVLVRHAKWICERCLAMALKAACLASSSYFALELLKHARQFPEALLRKCVRVAVASHQRDVASHLLQKLGDGFDVDERDRAGRTLLMLAVSSEDGVTDRPEVDSVKLSAESRLSTVQLLVSEHHASVKLVDMWGQTALYRAVDSFASVPREADYLVIETLVRAGGKDAETIVNRKTKEGRTALMAACESGHAALARMLLSLEADWGMRDAQGRDALVLAARGGHVGTVHAVLRHAIGGMGLDADDHEPGDDGDEGDVDDEHEQQQAAVGRVAEALGGWMEPIRPNAADREARRLVARTLSRLLDTWGMLDDVLREFPWLPSRESLASPREEALDDALREFGFFPKEEEI